MGTMLVAVVMVGKWRGAEAIYRGTIPGTNKYILQVREDFWLFLNRDAFVLFAALRD